MTNRRHHALECVNTRVPLTFEAELRDAICGLPSTVRNEYLKSEAFSKYVSSDTDAPDVRRQRAINKWLAAESTNRSTNERLLTVDPEYQILPRVTWCSFIHKLSSIVASVIGDVPPADIILGGFSGGASTSRMRTQGHPALKFEGEVDVTPRSVDLAIGLLVEHPLWLRYGKPNLNVVPGNIIFTVPKNAEVDRVAAKEPDLNMYMQRGVGSFIRRRLLRVGIDLNDQSRNRELARVGSIDRSLATLDLASASDSITTGLCLEVLPITWYTLLCDLRSEVTNIDGVHNENEMFSSMGNGFTFELESLLFYSICRTVAYFEGISGVISVYGDDIIIPYTLTHQVIACLAFCGFSVNPEKSHYDSNFRESCGGHFEGGDDITPFYVRRPIKQLSDLIEILNKIRRWSEHPSGFGVLDPQLFNIWNVGKSLVPKQLWGGRDLNSNSSLVTRDPVDHLMIPETRQLMTGLGGYILSLSTRGGLETTFSKRTISKERYVLKKQRVWNGPSPTPWCDDE